MAAAIWTNQQVINQLVSGYRWSGGVITYAFPTTTAGMTATNETSGFTSLNATQQYFASLALSLWDDVMGADLVPTTSSNSNIEFGNSTVGVGYAHAYFPTYGTVWFSSNYSDLTSPKIGGHGFLAYVHEIGHALGLDHMGDYNGSGAWTPSSYQDSTVYSIMSYFGPSWGSGSANGEGLVAWADWIGADGKTYSPQTPMLNDIMAIQTVYGAETTTRTGNTVYGFNSTLGSQSGGIFDFTLNKNPILCIYDSAGNDTLDLSGWSTSCVINLAPGSYSSGNSMTYNISIAYNCYIENGIGGSNADILTGNTLSNLLNGLDGNDTLNGGAGNDTLIGGSGIDTAIFSGTFGSYSVSYNAATAIYTITGSADGTDTVTGVEYFQFADGTKTAAQLIAAAPVAPTVSISTVAVSAAEGNSGTTIFTFQVSLSAAATSAQTVNYTVAGTGAAPTSSADFAGALTGVVSFAAGETSKTIQVLVVGDTVVEQNETFAVTLSGASSGLVLGTTQATATITNDDASPVSANVITGTNGNNVLFGTSDVDQINGLGGNDKLYGRAGNDTLIGGSGRDTLDGGAGSDWASYAGSSAVNVNLGRGKVSGGDATGDKFVSIENLKGSSYADTLIGSAAANILDGGLGNDTLIGGLGADTFRFSDAAFGKDKIRDYQDNLDMLSFSLSVADSFDDFVITGNGTKTVTVTHGADSIIVTSAVAFTLAADDFIFV